MKQIHPSCDAHGDPGAVSEVLEDCRGHDDKAVESDLVKESTQRRLKVLLIAEAANPEFVSVPLVGWSHAKAICEQVDGHVVTQVRNLDAIERAGWTHGVEFTAIDSERVAAPAYKLAKALPGGWTTKMAVTAFSYGYFERLVWRRFRDELMAGKWDIVHRLTPLSPTVPSPIARRLAKIGVSFVLGPLNGGVAWPREFTAARHAEREWLSYLREAYRLVPGYRSTRRNASVIICGSLATRDQMPSWCSDKCVYIHENAVDPTRFPIFVDRPVRKQIRVAFVGRLVPYKCPDILIEAAAPLIRAGLVTVDIIGDGPLMGDLRKQVEALGVADGVSLDGWVDHQHLQSRLVDSDVFGFPSIREFGGAVVLEAMATGLMPIVVNYGGPGELVDDDTGIRMPLQTRKRMIGSMREALGWAVDHPNQVQSRGRTARRKVLDRFTWAAKARQVRAVYDRVVAGDAGTTAGMRSSAISGPAPTATKEQAGQHG